MDPGERKQETPKHKCSNQSLGGGGGDNRDTSYEYLRPLNGFR